MARNVFIVNATQVVTSDSHPEGLYSTVSGFPKNFDSQNYVQQYGEEAEAAALRAAKSAYYDQLSKNYANANPARVMMTVTLEQADGRQYIKEPIGAFPEIIPEPEPEPEPEEPEAEQ
jgi:hypothetical protein